MPSEPAPDPVVLIVEDERNLADLYADWLAERFEVRTAYTGEDGLEAMDDRVDVVLLDRRLPGISGDEFLERIRERGYDCQVHMVSAVEPDFDILSMGFDGYLVKPVSAEDLEDVVQRALGMAAAGAPSRDYFALRAKRDALEAQKSEAELAASEEYAALLADLDEFKQEVLSLAESYLESTSYSRPSEKQAILRAELQEWRARKQSVGADDPLYDVATQKIEDYEERLSTTGEEAAAGRDLLEEVADHFIAEGFWLEPPVRRALNLLFYGKNSEHLVIDRTALEPGADLSQTKFFDLSQQVRGRAAEELEALE